MKEIDPIPTTEIPDACAAEPMVRAIHLIGDPWILLIVVNLLPGPRRFNELRELMGRISPKTLSQRLKLLEEIEMVERKAFLEIPPRVEYYLTEKGRALGDVVGAIEQFAKNYLSDLPASLPDTPCSS